MLPSILEAQVHRALNDAVANGYGDFLQLEPGVVADDLMQRCSDIEENEELTKDLVVKFVLSWRQSRIDEKTISVLGVDSHFNQPHFLCEWKDRGGSTFKGYVQMDIFERFIKPHISR